MIFDTTRMFGMVTPKHIQNHYTLLDNIVTTDDMLTMVSLYTAKMLKRLPKYNAISKLTLRSKEVFTLV